MRHHAGFRSAALLALGLVPGRPMAAWTAEEVLARAREAHGGAAWDAVRTLVLAATFHPDGQCQGEPGGIREDLAHGRYLRWHGQGDALHAWSFDGARFWILAGAGPAYPVPGQLRLQVARACAYMHARGYWFPDRFPATARYLGLDGAGGPASHVLRLEPEGALPLEVRVEAGSWRIQQIAWSLERGTWCHAFQDYRPVQGLLLPFLIRCGWAGDPAQTRIVVQAYHLRETLPEASYQRWPPPSSDGEGAAATR